MAPTGGAVSAGIRRVCPLDGQPTCNRRASFSFSCLGLVVRLRSGSSIVRPFQGPSVSKGLAAARAAYSRKSRPLESGLHPVDLCLRGRACLHSAWRVQLVLVKYSCRRHVVSRIVTAVLAELHLNCRVPCAGTRNTRPHLASKWCICQPVHEGQGFCIARSILSPISSVSHVYCCA